MIDVKREEVAPGVRGEKTGERGETVELKDAGCKQSHS
jgi:hypothetical protein